MGFVTDKIPYSLNFGLDLSNYNENIMNDNVYDIIAKIEELKLDYLVSYISLSDQQKRKSSLDNFSSPVFIDDFSLFSNEWKNKFIGKLHEEDLQDVKNSQELIKIDLEYLNHLNTKFIVLGNADFSESKFLLGKIIKKFLTDNPDRLINVQVPFSKEGLIKWQNFQSELGYLENLGVMLEIQPDLPEESVLSQFTSHNLKSIVLPLSIFVSNKSGYPVLSKVHQEYIKYMMGFKVEVIFFDDCDLLIKKEGEGNLSNSLNLSNFSAIKDYYIYLCHLFTNHREFQNVDYVLFNYLDIFQIPLQPLRDNLQSQTYECFEEDNVKYDYYERAVDKALENCREKGHLNLENIKKSMIVESSKGRVLTACVVGAGRGPLVRKVVSAALKNGMKIGENFKVICVEKNRNAFNTLLMLKIKEPEIFGKVDMIFSDMRDFNPDYKIDIVVSELLGSFGDNELSPECLIPIQKFLSDDAIMIPQSYTSYVRPVACPVIWSNIKRIKDNYQSPYVILLHKAYYPVKEASECFTFTHPVDPKDMNKMAELTFKFEEGAVIHGFAGYFKAVLYDDVTLSIIPYDHTPTMFSWFPAYFPSIHPISLSTNDTLVIHVVRENDCKKVWYEWNFEVKNKDSLECLSHQIHNLGGNSYSILL